MTKYIWEPNEQYLKSRVADFMKQEGIPDWRLLVEKSQKDINWFWSTALDFMGVQWTKRYEKLIDESKGLPWTNWFVGGQLNIAANCLDWHMEKGKTAGCRTSVGKDHLALIWESETGEPRKLTYGELNDLSGRIAALLLNYGAKPGDAIGIYMPMVPEVVAILFACFKIGAVAVPIFSGFGPQALASRLSDAKAKILFTANGGIRKGKVIPIKVDVDEAAKTLPDLKRVIVMDHVSCEMKFDSSRDVWLHDAIAKSTPYPTKPNLPAEHPCMYLYTSGTTGKPKGTVHTHGGSLATLSKELGFNFDVKPSDVFFWFTDIGWMMGPWEMIGVTFWGGTIVIYEGTPNHPHPDRLWQIVDKHKVTTLGISPTAVRVLKSTGDDWVDKYDLKSLRLLGGVGEPWDDDSYEWFFKKIGKEKCPIINISGGTELVGCLLMPLPITPLKSCSLGVPGLAVDVDVYSEAGKSVRNEIGHLVVKKPIPSMTKGFLGDHNRYLETYFKKFPRVWYHGDWAKVDEDGFWFLYGRSDDTIKVAGKRVGPGEVESALTSHSKVSEAAVIGTPHELKGETLVCFVVLIPGANLSEELEHELKAVVGYQLGATLRPEKIFQVNDLPKTRSGKVVRGLIRKRYLGEPTGDLSSVDNPEALDQFTKSN